MTLVADNVRIPGTGEVFVAATGSTAPTDVTAAVAAAFRGLGYTQDGGVTLGRTVNRDPVTAWQSVTPLKYVYTGVDLRVSAAFEQSQSTVAGLWWGADFAASGTEWRADLPTVPSGVERSVILSYTTDGGFKHRIYIPRAEVTDTGDVTVSRSATAFQITFSALAPSTGSTLASWFTNDPAFDPAA